MSVYHGQIKCSATYQNSGKPCRNKAYWSVPRGGDALYLCGTHSKCYPNRAELPKDPLKAEKLAKEYARRMKVAVDLAETRERRGRVRCAKLRMRHEAPHLEGYVAVSPNFKHGRGFKAGLGMPSLSPMSMGPVEHNQPGLPPSLNLENFHQFNKVFADEVDAEGDPTQAFYDAQLAAYADPTPHRRKQRGKVPLYSVWVTSEASSSDAPGSKMLNKLSYLESRELYCSFYAHFALQDPMYHKLLGLLERGVDLLIIGYDANPPSSITPEGLLACYEYLKKPFGHEMVLLTLLMYPDQPEVWPWKVHQKYL